MSSNAVYSRAYRLPVKTKAVARLVKNPRLFRDKVLRKRKSVLVGAPSNIKTAGKQGRRNEGQTSADLNCSFMNEQNSHVEPSHRMITPATATLTNGLEGVKVCHFLFFRDKERRTDARAFCQIFLIV